jgi:broad specificity phosphatase PhoE
VYQRLAVGAPAQHWTDTARLVEEPWWRDVSYLCCSDETKALETAALISGRTGLRVHVRPETHEVDRSATGFVPDGEHQALADALFAHPDRSARGWERAVDAQARVVGAVADLVEETAGDVVVVGHGAVGTLLMCDLASWAIDGRRRPSGQGQFWTYDRSTSILRHGWRPIDAIESASGQT